MWHSSPGLQNRHPSCAMDQQYPSRRVVSPLSPLSPLSLEDPSGIPSSLSPITPPSPTPVSHQHHGSFSRRCIPQSPPHIRRPLLNFPPPPAYPPPHPHHPGHHPGHHPPNHHHGQFIRDQDCHYRDRDNPAHVEEFTVIQVHQSARDDLGQPCPGLQPITEDLNLPGPSHQRGPQPSTSWDTGEIFPNDYSYAYYEPGPPTKHTNVPHRHPITGYRDRHSRHTYLTRYGTEENIYEEISDHARARMLLRPSQQQSMISLNQSIIEEEVRRVQHRHRKVLGELNLSVEAMLMPTSSSQDEDTDKEMDDQLADLLTVGPTDELLSPAPPLDLDSGFSGSSSGTSYVGSMRRGPDRYKSKCNSLKNESVNNSNTNSISNSVSGCASGNISVSKNSEQTGTGGSGKGFWSRKNWKKIPVIGGLGSGKSSSNDEPRARNSGTWDDPSPLRTGGSLGRPQGHGGGGGSGGGTPVRHHGAGHGHGGMMTPQRSSEDSWCSGSEPELSSDDESDRSAASSTSNGQLRNTLNKARTLCDKWRASGGSRNSSSLDGGLLPGDMSPGAAAAAQGRLSRWFSIRRGSSHQYDVEGSDGSQSPATKSAGNKMPLLPEVEEETMNTLTGCVFQQRRQVPPSLPPPPPNITPQQQKRRMIVAAIVHSENSYVATLQRLVNDYKKPLEESSPPILSGSKISTLFHRLPEILQCHTLFRIALAECVRNWDGDEKIGDVFVASFSKAIVLDIYSGFINNFSVAMDLAKMEAKRKSALADFLKVKQISSHDRLSFFGLMVKPVQRFPQFILFLQDLLKHTPQGHHDRMSLQLALTQLESLAEMLNERKREAEQFQAFKEMLRHISGKFTARPLSDGNRYLLREDNVTQLEFNHCGMITKSKSRRLLLLNDLVVCVSVAPKASDDFGASERLSLKWTYPVTDVEIQDTSASPTLTRLLTAGMHKGASLRSNGSNVSETSVVGGLGADNLCTEMSNLMHDFEVMSRIHDLVSSLKGSYKDMTVENTRRILNSIQASIQRKDEEMAWVDSCCLQLVVKNKGKEEVYTFQTDNPSVKKEWITELRLAQLALDPNNSPAWDVPEQEQRPSTKMPLFVRSQPVYKSQHQTEVRCGCFYTVGSTKPTRRKGRTQSYLWVCTTDGVSSHIAILAQHQQQAGSLKDVGAFDLVETQVTAMEFVRAANNSASGTSSGDTVWMGTDSRRLILYSAGEPEKQEELASCTVPAIIVQIKYHCDSVFVALGNGSLLVFRRHPVDGTWLLKEPQTMNLSSDTVSCLLPINMSVYAACGKKVWVLSGITGEIQKSFSVQHEHVGNVNLMAHSGIGLWISLKNSSTICLYHTETFKHLQDINIASNVMRVTSGGDTISSCTSRDCVNNNRSAVNVTALMACKGLLWVGTNVGICLTIPLPRLEGVPIISGRVNISYHAHFGPISFLLALQPKTIVTNKEIPVKEEEKLEKNESTESDKPITNVTAKLKQQLTSSPVVLRRRRSKELDMSRLSKTLPRGLGAGMLSMSTTSSQSSGDTCDVYGLYGELMYVKDYDGDDHELGDTIYESLRRSDPELAAIPGKVSTLDRRLKMKVSRPRSLDLSNWSVDSRSSSLYTSSGSEESMAVRNGRSISRNNSNASRTLNGVSEDIEESVAVATVPTVPTVVSSNSNNSKPVSSNKTLQKNISNNDAPRRTVITLMGGRGYVNWRQPCCTNSEKGKNISSIREPNSNDAHIVIWELKL